MNIQEARSKASALLVSANDYKRLYAGAVEQSNKTKVFWILHRS